MLASPPAPMSSPELGPAQTPAAKVPVDVCHAIIGAKSKLWQI